jgi:peptide/nickel transport system permease protein
MRAPARVALITLVLITLFTFVLPLVWTIRPEATDPIHPLAGPSGVHPLGTDELGRDVLSRLAHGGQVTLVVGVAAMLTALFLGLLVGGIAGFYGGWIDTVLMRFTDTMLALPAFFLVLVVVTVIGSDLPTLILVIGGLSWMPVARVVYGETLRWKVAEFVLAAESVGVPAFRLLVRHVLPQVIPVLVVSATLGIAYAILTESAVSYLGLGVQAPMPSWGNMLQRAQQYLFTAPVLALWPGLAIVIVVLTFNFVGEGVRDLLDPRSRRRLETGPRGA